MLEQFLINLRVPDSNSGNYYYHIRARLARKVYPWPVNYSILSAACMSLAVGDMRDSFTM